VFRWQPDPKFPPFFWKLITQVHDCYVYEDPFRMKEAFCLRCFSRGYLEQLKPSCEPRDEPFELHGEFLDVINAPRKVKVKAFKFYLRFRGQINICANPRCEVGIAPRYIFYQLLQPEHASVFTLLEYDIKPIFLCCNCIGKKEEFEKLEM